MMPGKNDKKFEITIRNWDLYQREMRGGEKRKRRREWIAISVDLFSDPDFFSMDQVHRNAWVGLLCHAGKVGPVFELCPSNARVMFQLRRCPDFEVFRDQGFIDLKAATYKTVTLKTNKTDNTGRAAFKEKVTKDKFAEFWALYPKKVKRSPSSKKWVTMKLDEVADKIFTDVRFRLENDVQWKNGFIPDPLTYLNQRRWEDEMIQTVEAGRESYSELAAQAADSVEKSSGT